jgi:hypothetical protein
VNGPRVMHETIDDEVMIIDLTTGSYYSLRDAATDVWQAIDRGTTEDEIVRALALRYEGSSDEMRRAVSRLLDELVDEGLIEASSGEVNQASAPAALGADTLRTPFRTPVLEKHTDMQDLILLDPVHEVDARGWPHAADGDRPAS